MSAISLVMAFDAFHNVVILFQEIRFCFEAGAFRYGGANCFFGGMMFTPPVDDPPDFHDRVTRRSDISGCLLVLGEAQTFVYRHDDYLRR